MMRISSYIAIAEIRHFSNAMKIMVANFNAVLLDGIKIADYFFKTRLLFILYPIFKTIKIKTFNHSRLHLQVTIICLPGWKTFKFHTAQAPANKQKHIQAQSNLSPLYPHKNPISLPKLIENTIIVSDTAKFK